MTNGTVPMEWIEEKPQKVWEFLEKQRPYWPPGENEKSGVTIIKATNQVNPMLLVICNRHRKTFWFRWEKAYVLRMVFSYKGA